MLPDPYPSEKCPNKIFLASPRESKVSNHESNPAVSVTVLPPEVMGLCYVCHPDFAAKMVFSVIFHLNLL